MIDQRAREILADEIESNGLAWVPLAASIRAGFTNLWLLPALAVISALLPNEDGEE